MIHSALYLLPLSREITQNSGLITRQQKRASAERASRTRRSSGVHWHAVAAAGAGQARHKRMHACAKRQQPQQPPSPRSRHIGRAVARNRSEERREAREHNRRAHFTGGLSCCRLARARANANANAAHVRAAARVSLSRVLCARIRDRT